MENGEWNRLVIRIANKNTCIFLMRGQNGQTKKKKRATHFDARGKFPHLLLIVNFWISSHIATKVNESIEWRLFIFYQDGASQTLQQVQKPPTVLQIAEHIFDGHLARLGTENWSIRKKKKKEESLRCMEKLHFHITLENCAFIHLVKVFFWTASCSSVEQREKRGSLRGELANLIGQIMLMLAS